MSWLLDYIEETVEKLPKSQPIFVATADKHNLYFELKHRVHLDSYPKDTPLDRLIAIHSRESFDYRDLPPRFVRSCREQDVIQRISVVILATYETNSGLKNPRQSSMYKWLYSVAKDPGSDAYRGFIELYKYIATETDVERTRFEGLLKKAHGDNVLAILEKMRKKYEDK